MMKQAVQPWTRAVVSALTGFMAVWAYAGAIGLVGGIIDLGPTVNRRLPFHSPVFAGVALAVVIAVPMTVAAWSARRAPAVTAIVAGELIVWWIICELAAIHTFNGLQAFFLVYGVFLTVLGISLFKRRRL